MSKFVVTVFDSQEAAYQGSTALQDLAAEGAVAVYAAAVMVKDADGTVRIVDGADEGPIGTLGGMLIGGLIGAFGGPAGMAAGALAGTTGGWIADMYNLGVDAEFVDDVGNALAPGKSAVVAELEEGWTVPLETRMEELGGTVFRQWRLDVEDAQLEREIEATERELDELDAELEAAAEETRAKVQAKIDAAKAKLNSLKKKTEQKVASMKAEVDAKVQALNEQIAKAKDDTKARFEKRREQLKADFEKRSAALKAAASKVGEALSV